ncbi:MAG: hypothetical protein ABI855_19540 [Bacteroidota bacterium]
MKFIFTLLLSAAIISAFAQQTQTAEDSLHHDSSSFLSRTTIGGYGNAVYIRDFNQKYSSVNLERFVLFVGHKFNKKISFFSELEVEDAKVAGGKEGGEIALEQCYLKFNVNPNNYFVAGLFLPRIGILNENHLPNTFNGNERTQVETFILPSTWRELGIGFYGTLNSFPLSYSLGIVNGLNAASFEHGSVIREGRFEGRNASANNLAATGAVQLNKNNFKAQVSGYYGGSVGLAPRQADSLKLKSGIFGTPVIVGEADLQYEIKGFSLRILGSMISIPDASDINRAYANNTPKNAFGAYGEIGYNILEHSKKTSGQQLILFVRYEMLDMNAATPANGIIDETLNQQHIVAGINYLPMKNVVIKADVRIRHTGEENPDLTINPSPVLPPYNVNNTFLNLGIGFSF